jgi:hypothetical protein
MKKPEITNFMREYLKMSQGRCLSVNVHYSKNPLKFQ